MTDTTANATEEMVERAAVAIDKYWMEDSDVRKQDEFYGAEMYYQAHCRGTARAALNAALSAAPSSPVTGGVVKAIEWGETSYGSPEAYTAVGVYRINEAMNGGWSVTSKKDVLRDTDGRSNFPTIEAAKAAAQQHYTKSVLSCLTSPTGTEELREENERLREAVMVVVSATNEYLPPDGISAQECLSRILHATDNPTINPIIARIEEQRHGRS